MADTLSAGFGYVRQRKYERDNMVTLRWRGNVSLSVKRSPALPSCKELRSKNKKRDISFSNGMLHIK